MRKAEVFQPHIEALPDGQLQITEELALYVVQNAAQVCEHNGVPGSPQAVAMLLGMCCGFALGMNAPGRDGIPPEMARLQEAVRLGVSAGMVLNPHLPRLNS